jgi:hypothetical protein
LRSHLAGSVRAGSDVTAIVVTMVIVLLVACVVISIFAEGDEDPSEAEETGLGDLLEP